MIFPAPRSALAALSALVSILAAGCSSPPERLYLLSSSASSVSPAGIVSTGSGSSQPPHVTRGGTGPVVGVGVSVPEYLDRLDVVERAGANELKPVYTAQWGEPLAATATRALAENLMARLPSNDIVILPSRSRRIFEYQVNLDLTHFESDSLGNSVLAGRWSIQDRDGNERASGRVDLSEKAGSGGYDGMAAAMSHNLARVSAEIATALQSLSGAPANSAVAPPHRKPGGGRSHHRIRPSA